MQADTSKRKLKEARDFYCKHVVKLWDYTSETEFACFATSCHAMSSYTLSISLIFNDYLSEWR